MTMSAHIDQGDLARVRLMLGAFSPAVPKITRMAVNKTLTGVRTDATNEVAKVITPTKTKIRKTITTKKMWGKNDIAYVLCKGKRLGLIHFKARQTKKGVSVQVKKSEPRSLIKHAFIMTMKSGHKGVFWREWEGTRKPVSARVQYGRLPKQYRLPMSERFSFAIPEVLGHPPTIKKVLELAGPRLKKNVDDALNYEFRKIRQQ